MAPHYDFVLPVAGRLTALEGAVLELRRQLAENPTRGKDGKDGKSITGPQGPAGRDGRDGVDGDASVVPGPRGLDGKDGRDGKDCVCKKGLDGKDGERGPVGPPGQSIRGEKGEKGDDVNTSTKYGIGQKIIEIETAVTELQRTAKALSSVVTDTAEKIRLLTVAFESSSQKNKDYITFLQARVAQRQKDRQQ